HSFKRRPDDNAETVRTRMGEYRGKTAPILPYYDAQGIVTRIDGMAAMDEVGHAIDGVLAG
ncbi:MAG: adenylate kinase, partial [Hyphomicrobium sp.]|nr:adenylate kinase [Hyphomicrobium sp.]